MRIVVILTWLLILPVSALGQVADWKQVKDRVAGAIVHVRVVHETREYLKPYRQGDLKLRMGTGFFVSKGLLVTNQHVIEGARTIKVEGVGSKEKFAMRVAAEPSVRFDLALLEFVSDEERLRFEAVNGPIQPLEWGEWEAARPGAQVAVLGFGNSDQLVATQGIISNWEPRHDLFQRRLDHVTLIRTDAAVNPGNSGGPVVSDQGRVIGISARYGAGENIGLLIPFVTARQVVAVMRKEGRFVKTDPGLIAYNLNPVLRATLGLDPGQQGMVVSHVLPGSPADRAGLRQWDVLTSVDGYAIEHGEIRHEHIGKVPYWFVFNAAPEGTRLALEVLRGSTHLDMQLNLTPVSMPRIWLPTEGEDYRAEWGFLGGLVITEVTRDLLEEIEEGGNWRWDLVNDAPRAGKLYVVANIEPGTQAMAYQEYGLDMLQLRVLAIDGVPLEGALSDRLDALYHAVEEGSAPEVVTVDLEKHISIRLDTARLAADMQALEDRYPAIARKAPRPAQTARGGWNRRAHQVSHRWLGASGGGKEGGQPVPGSRRESRSVSRTTGQSCGGALNDCAHGQAEQGSSTASQGRPTHARWPVGERFPGSGGARP